MLWYCLHKCIHDIAGKTTTRYDSVALFSIFVERVNAEIGFLPRKGLIFSACIKQNINVLYMIFTNMPPSQWQKSRAHCIKKVYFSR